MSKQYQSVVQTFFRAGIIPVIRLDQTNKAAMLAKALADGEMEAAEVTFRAQGAVDKSHWVNGLSDRKLYDILESHPVYRGVPRDPNWAR